MEHIKELARMTKHAAQRFAERFPGEDIATSFARSVWMTYRILRGLYDVRRLSGAVRSNYFLDRELGALFTITESDGRGGEVHGAWVVATVMKLEKYEEES